MRATLLIALVVLTGCTGSKGSPLRELAAQHDGKDLSHAIPIFNVRSLKASQRYYRDVLGFKVDWEDGAPPTFGAVSRGHATIFMCEGCKGPTGSWVMTFTEDVDRLHRELVAKKAIVLMPPRDMPWKLREMHVSDPDGNVLRVASRPEH